MSANRSRWLGPLERRALALAFACSACFSIDFTDSLPETERTAARYIDTLCASGSYELEGAAERTTGLTSDSCGFSVGPGEGTVRLIVTDLSLSYYASYTFEVLLASKDGTNPRWRPVTGQQQAGIVGTAFAISAQPGEQTRIIDARIQGVVPDDSLGCSMARRRVRR